MNEHKLPEESVLGLETARTLNLLRDRAVEGDTAMDDVADTFEALIAEVVELRQRVHLADTLASATVVELDNATDTLTRLWKTADLHMPCTCEYPLSQKHNGCPRYDVEKLRPLLGEKQP